MPTYLICAANANEVGKGRDFLWDDKAQKRKQHLVKWSEMIAPKRHGGIGVMNLKVPKRSLLIT